jgi:hypothetical protein
MEETPMTLIAYAMLTLAGLWAALAVYVVAVIVYDETTGHERVLADQARRAAERRAARYSWAPPPPCPICAGVAHTGGCPPTELLDEPMQPTLQLLDAA